MSVTPTKLSEGNNNSSLSEYTLPSITTPANVPVTMWLTMRETGGSVETPSSISDPGGRTWVEVEPTGTINFSRRKGVMYRTMTETDVTSAPTVNFTAEHDGIGWEIEKWDGAKSGGTHGSEAIVQSQAATRDDVAAASITATLDTAPAATSVVYAGFVSTTNSEVTSEAGWVELVDRGFAAGRIASMWDPDGDQSATFEQGSSTEQAAVIIEVAAEPVPVLLDASLAGLGAIAAVLERTATLDGTLTGSGETAGVLTVERPLNGALAGVGAIAAALERTAALEAALVGEGELPATLERTSALVATLTGDGQIAAALERTAALEAALVGEGAIDGRLDVPLFAALVGEGAVDGVLTVERPLAADLSGEGSVDATLLVDRLLGAALAGETAIVAPLHVERPLVATLAGAGEVAAGLEVDRLLEASLAGAGEVVAVLGIDRALVAALAGVGDVDAVLERIALLEAALTGQGGLVAKIARPVGAFRLGSISVIPLIRGNVEVEPVD